MQESTDSRYAINQIRKNEYFIEQKEREKQTSWTASMAMALAMDERIFKCIYEVGNTCEMIVKEMLCR